MILKNLFFRKFWGNKKVLITGHNGFKGSWLSLLLTALGADVYGISLENQDPNSLFNSLNFDNQIKQELIDIRNFEKIKKSIQIISPEIIFHLAAQPLVRESYLNPVDTWSTNVMGTISILEAARAMNKRAIFIGITTDKVYQNKEWIYGYREIDRLGGDDPYSSSKAASELAINTWRKSFANNSKLIISSARAGNVIGGGDYAKDRIIPDIIRAFKNNSLLSLRNPNSTRPWQHVLEPLWGYILLAEMMSSNPAFADAYNFGPGISSNKTVLELVQEFSKIIKVGLKIDKNQNDLKESNLLNLVSEKARSKLNWQPIWNFEKTISITASWYNKVINNNFNSFECCVDDITEFMRLQNK